MKKRRKIVSEERAATKKESESELDEEHVCSKSCFAIAHTRGGSLDHFSAIARTRRRGFDRIFARAENPRFEFFFMPERERAFFVFCFYRFFWTYTQFKDYLKIP